MKLALSTTSFAATLALFVTPKYSKAALASSIDAAYEDKIEHAMKSKHVEARSLGKECSFTSLGSRGNDADTGILGCPEGYVCIEYDGSSLGGFCVSANVDHRDLLFTTCTKCTGTNACAGLTQDFINNNIGDGSCCGSRACQNLGGETICLLQCQFHKDILKSFFYVLSM